MIRHMWKILATTALVSVPSTGFAQEVEEEASNSGLKIIVVTATKRETSTIDAPISLAAVSGETIAQGGITDVADLTQSIPNVNIGEGYTAGSVNIRGLGSGSDRGFEQSVALFVDEIYMPRSRQYRAALFDVDRVEVLRGPQAVLYGLNATAGTITITSAISEPGDPFFAEYGAGYEFEYSGYEMQAITGGGVTDNLGIRLAARFADTGDGYYFNQATGKRETSKKDLVIRGTAVLDVADTARITARATYSDSEQFGDNGELYGSTALALTGDGTLDWVRNTNVVSLRGLTPDHGFFVEALNLSLRGDFEIGSHTLSAIVGYTDTDVKMSTTALVAAEGGAQNYIEQFEQFSGELRLSSDPANRFSYIAGIYYANSDNLQHYETNFGPFLLGSPGLSLLRGQDNNIDVESISPFVSGTFNISDRFRITGGLRYSHETKSVDLVGSALERGTPCGFYLTDGTGNFTFAAPFACVPIPAPATERSSGNWMPEVIAQYDIADETVVYARFGQSVKSGGFATSSVPLAARAYDDEKATTYEVGLKSRFLDNRAQIAISAFRTEFKDLQVNTFIPDPSGNPGFIASINNAAKVTSQGFEIEGSALLADWLTLSGSLGYLDTTYNDFAAANCFPGATPNSTVVPGKCDLAGQNTPFSPEFSGSLGADIDFELSDSVRFVAGANMSFSSSHFTEGTLDPAAVQPSYQRYDARIGLAGVDDEWSISLIGKNLSEEAILSATQPIVGNVGFINAPRTIMLKGTFKFGG
jgi:iron complex outermembrane receptor protein